MAERLSENFRKMVQGSGKSQLQGKKPVLMWNCLWKSGASLIHGHMQLTSSKVQYGRIRHLQEISEGYNEIFGTDYFEDLYSVHESLGLAKKSGASKIIFCLTPKKEKEILIFSKVKNFVELSPLLFRIIGRYKNLGVQSYNLALFQINRWWICGLIDRGELKNNSSDIGAMELFADSVVASDPFRLAENF
jgi:galactose-1-phosphate uridylyltransferase